MTRSEQLVPLHISSRMWKARRILGMISKARLGETLHLLIVSWASGKWPNLLIVWTYCLEFSLAIEDTLVEVLLCCTANTARMEYGIQWKTTIHSTQLNTFSLRSRLINLWQNQFWKLLEIYRCSSQFENLDSNVQLQQRKGGEGLKVCWFYWPVHALITLLIV